MSLRDGVIQAVEPAGAEVDAEQVRDARGGLLLPGFTDSHVHLLVGAERLDGCDVGDVRDPAELELRIRRFAQANPDRPMLQVHGLNYLEPPLLDPARARARLDEIVKDRPLMVVAHDLHTVWANTRALEESGLLRAMPPYPREIVEIGAETGIGLDDQGLPGGELREPECYCLVEGAIRAIHPLKQEQKLASLRRAAAELNRHGITSVHNMGLAMPEEDIELLLLLLELEEKEELTIRVESSYSVVPDEHMLEDVHDAAEIRDRLRRYREGALTVSEMHRFLVGRLEALAKARRLESKFVANHDEVARIHVQPHLEGLEKRLREARSRTAATRGMVTLDAVKLFLDGVVEKETAYRTDRPPQNGLPSFPPEDLEETVRIADRLGLQVRAHCIGDKSVSLMLDAISAARQANARPDERRGHRIRHRIEHVEMCRPEDLVRFQSEDAVASMQPFHERPPSPCGTSSCRNPNGARPSLGRACPRKAPLPSSAATGRSCRATAWALPGTRRRGPPGARDCRNRGCPSRKRWPVSLRGPLGRSTGRTNWAPWSQACWQTWCCSRRGRSFPRTEPGCA